MRMATAIGAARGLVSILVFARQVEQEKVAAVIAEPLDVVPVTADEHGVTEVEPMFGKGFC